MRKIFARLLTMVLAFSLLFGVAQFDSYAATKYKINGVTVSVTDYSSEPNECWVYANKLYLKIWGEHFTNKFDHSSNSLRNLSDSQLTLTPEHLKRYVLNAEPGAVLRVCDKKYLHGNDGWGHSQLIVQKDANGFTVLEGGLSNSPYRREHYYTWEGYCNSRWPGKYEYIKYIKWPDAPAFKEPNGTLTAVPAASDSSAVTLKWTTYWEYNEKYCIERATAKDGPWTVVKKITDGDTMTWTDTTTAPGKNYYYRVEPYDETGDDGKYTNVAQVLTRSSLTTASESSPAPKITLQWTKTEGYTAGYWIYRKPQGGSWTKVATCADGNTTSWTDTDLTSGVRYYYYVQPYNSSNKGGTGSITVSNRAYVLATEPFDGTVMRISGKDRYATSYAVADALKATLDLEQFDTVLLATGTNFADALSGSYLAYVESAPIILTNGKTDGGAIASYLEENLASDGIVYILGGENAVSKDVADALSGFVVERLSGATRYDTNVKILEKAGVTEESFMVCTGTNYADSLSAAAVKKPILLVGETLSESQKAYLNTIENENFYIAGGTVAVSESVEDMLSEYGTIEKRFSGSNRYETSNAIAREFMTDPTGAILVYGRNFPDGLCGGPLAAALEAPIILTEEDQVYTANDYMQSSDISEGMVLGGPAALSDLLVRVVFDLCLEDPILTYVK